MNLSLFISKLHQYKSAKLFIILLRIVLGLAFIYPSIPKIMNTSFTILGKDNPVGYFFDSLERLPLYWQFLGWGQLICGLLLLTQRFAFFGNIIYLGYMVNIFFITVSLNMTGTPIVTFLMLCAGLLFAIWDIEKWKSFFTK